MRRVGVCALCRVQKRRQQKSAKLVDKVVVFQRACMEALEQILQTKNSIPDKIAMFCAHSTFYQLPETMHVLYVDLVLQGANSDLAKWDGADTESIRQISMEHATKDQAEGVRLWNLLLDRLIHLPLDTVHGAADADSDGDDGFGDAADGLSVGPHPLGGPPPPPPPQPDLSHLPPFLQQIEALRQRQDAEEQKQNVLAFPGIAVPSGPGGISGIERGPKRRGPRPKSARQKKACLGVDCPSLSLCALRWCRVWVCRP